MPTGIKIRGQLNGLSGVHIHDRRQTTDRWTDRATKKSVAVVGIAYTRIAYAERFRLKY